MTSGPDEYAYRGQIDLDADMVARRIVMHQKLWDELVSLAESMTKQKGVLVTPSDVAVMAIETGITKQSAKPTKNTSHRKPKHGR